MKEIFKMVTLQKVLFFTVLTFFVPQLVLADCQLNTDKKGQRLLIEAQGGLKFKIEKDWIKALVPSAFETFEWGLARFSGDQAEITGQVKTSKGTKNVSHFYVEKKGGKQTWFLLMNSDVRTGNGTWTIATNAYGHYSCEEISTSDAVAYISSLKQDAANANVVVAHSADLIYNQLGLS